MSFLLTRSTWGHQLESAQLFYIQGYHLLGPAVPDRCAKVEQDFFPPEFRASERRAPQHLKDNASKLASLRFGLFRFRSPLLAESISFFS